MRPAAGLALHVVVAMFLFGSASSQGSTPLLREVHAVREQRMAKNRRLQDEHKQQQNHRLQKDKERERETAVAALAADRHGARAGGGRVAGARERRLLLRLRWRRAPGHGVAIRTLLPLS